MGKEKKEIGKLLELLNEYQYGMFVYEDDLLLLRIGSNIKVGGETFIISKKLGFIEWLVDNDKIDLEKVYNNSDYPMVKRDEFLYEGLLMLLAIQDEPIRFLCEIIK